MDYKYIKSITWTFLDFGCFVDFECLQIKCLLHNLKYSHLN